MESRVQTLMEQVADKRKNLTESVWGKYVETLPTETPNWEKGNLAQILENQAKYYASQGININEDTTTGNVASFEKFIFPMIRTVWPNLVSQELVSVQVMDGPVSMLFYMDFTAGSSKGSVRPGDALANARSGMNENAYTYAMEKVEAETLATLVSGNTTSAYLSYVPVRPGGVVISFTETLVAPPNTETTYTMYDDGNGGLSAAGTAVTGGTINYQTGHVHIVTGVDVTVAYSLTQATYDYNSEGSDTVPIVDLELTAAPVVSRPSKLRARWSTEVAAMMRAVHGLDAELELTEGLAQQLRFGIDNNIINDLWRIASGGSTSFNEIPPTGIPYFTHQMTLTKELQNGSNQIFKKTRRGFANWIVCGVDAATILESHPLFESAGNLNGPGVVFSGVYANRWKVFKNPFLTSTHPSGFGSRDFLMGYKGNNFYDAGYAYCPWISFFATPTVMLDDMVSRKAIMSHYATKAINGMFFLRGAVTAIAP
ncbi:MAG: hypothetical protein WCJ49_04750 [Deltaproteobacteria bacterium]